MTDAKKSKKKSPIKKSFSGKASSKKPTTRSGRILRGPLFWILVAILVSQSLVRLALLEIDIHRSKLLKP